MKFNNLGDYSDEWLLKYNVDFCCTLHYNLNIPNHNYQMHENGRQTVIRHSDTEKDLGISLDTDLKFRRHIKDRINKGNRVNGLIRRWFLRVTRKPFSKLHKKFHLLQKVTP